MLPGIYFRRNRLLTCSRTRRALEVPSGLCANRNLDRSAVIVALRFLFANEKWTEQKAAPSVRIYRHRPRLPSGIPGLPETHGVFRFLSNASTSPKFEHDRVSGGRR